MSSFEATNEYFDEAARRMDLPAAIERLLVTPRRELQVRVAIERDDGSVSTFVGFRVQHRFDPHAQAVRCRFAQRGGSQPIAHALDAIHLGAAGAG